MIEDIPYITDEEKEKNKEDENERVDYSEIEPEEEISEEEILKEELIFEEIEKEAQITEENYDKELSNYKPPTMMEVLENPDLIIKSENNKQVLEITETLQKDLTPIEEYSNQYHPGFYATYSFGDREYERLLGILARLDQVAEKVLTYRKSEMQFFPEFYAITKNLFYNLRFMIDTPSRKRINQALNYIKVSVIEYTTTGNLNYKSIVMLEEVYGLLMNIKNFHNLGFSYEKKRGDSAKYYDKIFGSNIT